MGGRLGFKIVAGPWKGKKVQLYRTGGTLHVAGLTETVHHWYGEAKEPLELGISISDLSLQYVPRRSPRQPGDVAAGVVIGTALLGPVGLLAGAVRAAQHIDDDFILITYPTDGPERQGALYLGGMPPKKLAKVYPELVDLLS